MEEAAAPRKERESVTNEKGKEKENDKPRPKKNQK